MVATRKSLPNLAVELPEKEDKSVPIELRRLFINGKGTMRGEAPQPREERVYHWRGAAYAITDDTPQEWLDQEPERWKNRDGRDQVGVRARRDSVAAPPVVRGGTKRKSTSAWEERRAGDDGTMAKRRRTSPPAVVTDPDCGSPKRFRRSLPTRPSESPLRFDFTRESGEIMLEHVEEGKKAARKKGYNVDALPSQKSREEREREAAGYRIAANVREMASLNSRISRLKDKYDRLRSRTFLNQRKRSRREWEREADAAPGADQMATAAGGTRAREDRTRVGEEDRSQLDRQLNGIREEPVTDRANHDTSSTSTRPESVPSTALITSPELTGASSDTTPPPEEPESDKTAREGDTHAHAPAEPMPSHNRGGQHLRWSLPKSKPPRLSNHLHDGERAESAIHKGRMNGESKQARRRRIRREMAILRGWPEDGSVA